MVGGWKSSLTESPCGEVPNWQSTPRWCPPSGRVGLPDAMQHTGTALLWRKHEERRRASTQPELVGNGGRARLVVVAAEVEGEGRFSPEAAQFLRGLVSAKVRGVPDPHKGKAAAAWFAQMAFCAGMRGRELFCVVPPRSGAPRRRWRGSSVELSDVLVLTGTGDFFSL